MHSIADVYDADPQREWQRLDCDAYHRLEFIVFMHHIGNGLPVRGLVLDAGGGPGRYAIELARTGRDVVLLDLSRGCIEAARAKIAQEPSDVRERVLDTAVGDVTDLSRFGAATFDGVICLDPLSCLHDARDRDNAVHELVRVAKPGAIVALAVRGYLDVLRTILRVASQEIVNGSLGELERTGNDLCAGVPHHFFRADELRALAEKHGLDTLLMAGGEGLSSGLPEATEAAARDPGTWERWVRTVIATSTVPAIVDGSGHMLLIGRKTMLGSRSEAPAERRQSSR